MAKQVLDAWRAPPISPDSRQRGEEGHPIDDPTERTLKRAISDAAALLRDYQ